MAVTLSSTLLQVQPSFRTKTTGSLRTKPKASFQIRAAVSGSRRQLAVALTAATIGGVGERASKAAEIGLFGIRRGLKKAEEQAEEIVREGFEAADKGIESAEKAVVAAENEVLAAEESVEKAVSFGGLAQAVAVVGAELVGVLVATAVVNSILGPEATRSSS